MKRASASLILLVAVLALSSCSSIDDFVVINRSDLPIEIAYTFMRAESGEINVERPRIMDAANLKTDRLWEIIPSGQYQIDSQAGKVAVMLAPGKALLLKSALNYREESESADAEFGISSLSITGAKGSISLCGRQARALFRDEDKRHVIAYE